MKRNKRFQKEVDSLIYEESQNDFLHKAHSQIKENRESVKDKQRIKVTASATATGDTIKQYNRSQIYIIISVLALFVIVGAIILTLLLNKPFNKSYSYDGDTEVVSIERLNSKSEIQFNEIDEVSVSCAYDTVYHDELFYILSYSDDDSLDDITIIVKTNKDYNYGFINPEHWDKTEVLKGHVLNYNEETEIEDDVCFITISGKIECGNDIVYISYEGVSLTERSNFLLIIDMLIKH